MKLIYVSMVRVSGIDYKQIVVESENYGIPCMCIPVIEMYSVNVEKRHHMRHV